MNNKENIDWDSIVAGVINNNQESIREFVELAQKPLFQFCFYLTSNRQLAEDICHDTLIKALGAIKNLKKRHQALAWMKQIARRLFLDYVKSAAQSKVHVDIDHVGSLADSNSDPETKDRQLLAMQALRSLDEDDRSLVILIDIQGHSYAEAAQATGITEGTAKSRVFRARKKMLHFLETNSHPGSSN